MRKDMTIGNPLKIILLFSLPVLAGNIFQQFYNMVDTVIVGQYLGEDALAAVRSTGCLMFLVLGFANGIAQGFGVLVAHAFGAKDMKLLRHYVALSLALTLVAVVPYLLPMFTSIPTSSAIGGTGIIIVVGVAMETMKQIKGQLTQKSYHGFLN